MGSSLAYITGARAVRATKVRPAVTRAPSTTAATMAAAKTGLRLVGRGVLRGAREVAPGGARAACTRGRRSRPARTGSSGSRGRPGRSGPAAPSPAPSTGRRTSALRPRRAARPGTATAIPPPPGSDCASTIPSTAGTGCSAPTTRRGRRWSAAGPGPQSIARTRRGGGRDRPAARRADAAGARQLRRRQAARRCPRAADSSGGSVAVRTCGGMEPAVGAERVHHAACPPPRPPSSPPRRRRSGRRRRPPAASARCGGRSRGCRWPSRCRG